MMQSADALDRLLAACIAQDGSDLHFSPGLPPHIRIHGELAPLAGEPVCGSQEVARIAGELLRRCRAGNELSPMPTGSVDGAVTAPGGVRFRFNVFRRQGEMALALRRLEDRFRTLADLGLPESLLALCDLRDGLVIVSGPTGAGKSTTLATLLDHVNRTRRGHIITIEDPVEYLHAPVRCVVNQRQVGLDTPSFNDALVASLRQDPDVVLVGEIRDLDTIRTAITAAETGHLVFTTLHAGDGVGSIERLVSIFPSDEQEGIRRQLALVLRGIVAQRLLPAATNGHAQRRVACSEILINTPAVANLVATGKSAQIYSAMETGASHGMQTLEQDLARLWVAGRISEVTAAAIARQPNVLRERAANLRATKNGGAK
ncbi:MAG: PilT/PilU family type 4a pilus ATPase [Chthoniobacter sp.]|nr:PilT/PilU family type 4a pilus ATPase [Chthoniobacter sp.]